MTKKLYKLMNWAEIEGIIYSEEDNPHKLLGATQVAGGTLVQFFYPEAKKVTLLTQNESFKMEEVDEEGYFAILLPKTTKLEYTFHVEFKDKKILNIVDPYNFEPIITKADTEKFNHGIHYNIYNLLGAHPIEVNGVKGVHFAVWAPNAMRVSVVGDFNNWDGRVHQMRRLWDSGIFEIFIPATEEGDNYKFEIKVKGGITYLKADPYASYSQMRPDSASVVADLTAFTWSDNEWLSKRKKINIDKEAMSVYEVHLGSFKKPEKQAAGSDKDADGIQKKKPEKTFYNYRELAPMIIDYVKEMGYTHIELMPIMEHPLDASWGYQVIGYYAPTSRYGTPLDFKYFMNEMHKNGIGVILDWVPAHFPRDSYGLSNFDGTSLYEHSDPRKNSHPHWGTLIFNYGRPEVQNYLIANALYWIKEFHADGIRMDAVASMLYLDYGKKDGEWVPNIYGGKENLDAIDFLKHVNSIVHKEKTGALMIAEESTAWPKITGSLEENGLGFDLKWNMGWMNDFINYMKFDPFFRGQHHGELTFSMIYAYSERYMLILSHDEVVHGKSSMIGKMPGEIHNKFKNLKTAYSYMMAHPGKKLLFMGQDIGEFDEWNEERSVKWELLQHDEHKGLNELVKACNQFYRQYPALYTTDSDSNGFEWINNISANENVLIFLRKTAKEDETLLVVCNFANEKRNSYTIGVPFSGKYKEVFNSDSEKFNGTNCVNDQILKSVEKECDDRENSITISMPALAVQIFAYIPFTNIELEEIAIQKEEERKIKEEEAKRQAAIEAEECARNAAKEAIRLAKEAEAKAKAAKEQAVREEKHAKELREQAQKLEATAKEVVEAEKKRRAQAEAELRQYEEKKAEVKKELEAEKKSTAAKRSPAKPTAKTSAPKKTTTRKTTAPKKGPAK